MKTVDSSNHEETKQIVFDGIIQGLAETLETLRKTEKSNRTAALIQAHVNLTKICKKIEELVNK